jgi:hypothetical protein
MHQIHLLELDHAMPHGISPIQLNHLTSLRVRALASLSRCHLEEQPRVLSGEREAIKSLRAA